MNLKVLESGSRETWEHVRTEVFWGEIAPSEHVLQIYDTEEAFLDTLIAFVGSAVNAGDCAVVLATESHLNALNNGLVLHGIQVPDLIVEGRYIPLVASVALSKFMMNDMPDEQLFRKMINMLLIRAQQDGRKVRVFGELAALLWAEGNQEATVALEEMWCNIWKERHFSLLCAYPVFGFTDTEGQSAASLNNICRSHTKIIAGAERQTHQVYYSNISQHSNDDAAPARDASSITSEQAGVDAGLEDVTPV